ncbi:MAG: FtsX-like permease family protein [Planctomycetota bacterium]
MSSTATETVASPRAAATAARWILRLLLLASAITLFFINPRHVDVAIAAAGVLAGSFAIRVLLEVGTLLGTRGRLRQFINIAWTHNVLLGLLYPVWHKLLWETSFAHVVPSADWMREVLVAYLLLSLGATIGLHLHYFLRGRWNTLCSTIIIFFHSVVWLVVMVSLVALPLIVLPAWYVVSVVGADLLSLPVGVLAGYYLLLALFGIYCLLTAARTSAAAEVSGNGKPARAPWMALHRSPLGIVSVVLVLLWFIPGLIARHPRNRLSLTTAGIRTMAGNRTLLDWYTLLLLVTGLVALSTVNFLKAGNSALVSLLFGSPVEVAWRPFLPEQIPGNVLAEIAWDSALAFLVTSGLAILLIGWLFLKRHFTTVVALRLVIRRALSYTAVVTVALGVFVLVVVTAVMGGFKQELRKRVRGSLSHLFMYVPVPELKSSEHYQGILERYELDDDSFIALDDHYQLLRRSMGLAPMADLRDREQLDRDIKRLTKELGVDVSDHPSFAVLVPRIITAQMLDRIPPGASFAEAVMIALRTRLKIADPTLEDGKISPFAYTVLQAKAQLAGCTDWRRATTPEGFVSCLRRHMLAADIEVRRRVALRLNEPEFRAHLRNDIEWALAESVVVSAPISGVIEDLDIRLGRGGFTVMPGTRLMDVVDGGRRYPIVAEKQMRVLDIPVVPGRKVAAGDPLMVVAAPYDLRRPLELRTLRRALDALDAIGRNSTDVIAGASGRIVTMSLIVRRTERDLDYCNLIGIDPVHDITVSEIGMHLEQALYKEMDQALIGVLESRQREVLGLFPNPQAPPSRAVSVGGRDGITPDQINDIGRQLFEQIDITAKMIDKLPSRDPGPGYALREQELLTECKQRLLRVIEMRTEPIIAAMVKGRGMTADDARRELQLRGALLMGAAKRLGRGDEARALARASRERLLEGVTGEAHDLIEHLTEQEYREAVDVALLRDFVGTVISGVIDLRDWLGRYLAGSDPMDLPRVSLQFRFQPEELASPITVLPDAGSVPVLATLKAVIDNAARQIGDPALAYADRLALLTDVRTQVNAALSSYANGTWPVVEDQLRRGEITPASMWSALASDPDYRFTERDLAAISESLRSILAWSNGFEREVPTDTFFARSQPSIYDCLDRLIDRDLELVRGELYARVAGTGPFLGVTLVPDADGRVTVERIDPDATKIGAAGKVLQPGDRIAGINDVAIGDFGDLRAICNTLLDGVGIRLEVKRQNNATTTFDVSIDEPFRPGVRQIVPFDRELEEEAAHEAQWSLHGDDTRDGPPQTRNAQSQPVRPLTVDDRMDALRQEFPPAIVGDKLAAHYGAGLPMRPGWRTRLHLAIAVPTDDTPSDDGKPREDFVAREQGFHIAGTFHSRLYEDDRRRIYIPIDDALRFVDGSRTAVTVAVKLSGTRYEQTPMYMSLLSCAAAKEAATRALGGGDRESGDLSNLSSFLSYIDVPERIRSWEDERASLLQAVDREEMILTIVLSMIILYAGIMIVIIIYLMVKEKTKDIGVLKALGGSPDGIQSIFLFNGLFIGVFGALLGLAMGLTVAFQSNWIEDTIDRIWGVRIFPGEIYYLSYIPMKTDDPMLWVMICVPTILLSFLFALYPAGKAAKMDPVESLQYE